MHVRGTEGEAVEEQRRINEDSALRVIQKIVQVEQVSFAAADAVASRILIEHKHLARAEPTLDAIIWSMKISSEFFFTNPVFIW